MKIPSWNLWREWRRFLTGMAIGGIISWGIFVYIYGVWQERNTTKIHAQKDEINDLKSDIKIWQDEFKELNQKNLEKMTVQEIKVKVKNGDKYMIDTLSIFEVEESVKSDLNNLIAKDLETVYKSRELIKKVVENKVMKLNNKRYRFEVTEAYFYTTLNIELNIFLAK